MDGWRAAVWTRQEFVQSRKGTNLAARFPEILAATRELGDLVLDGELVALRDGGLDFGALAVGPRKRVELGASVYFVVFDLIAESDQDWRPHPYRARRRRLEHLLAGVDPPLQLIPATTDREEARRWMDPAIAQLGIEGAVVKLVDRPYRPGRTGDWVRIRHTTLVDAVVVGVTGSAQRPEELVLARPDETGQLQQIGLSLPLPPQLRDQAGPHVTATGEPRVRLSAGLFGRGRTEYLPVRPTLVVEVQAEASVASFANRLRPKVHRLRPDLPVDQLDDHDAGH